MSINKAEGKGEKLSQRALSFFLFSKLSGKAFVLFAHLSRGKNDKCSQIVDERKEHTLLPSAPFVPRARPHHSLL